VASAAMGAAAAFFFPAYSAILPRILPADQLLAANGVEGVVRPVFQRAVGPAVAGIVVGASFPALGATTVALLFAIGLILLVATRTATKKPAAEPDHERPHVLRDMRDGFAFMLRTPWLLSTLLFASMMVLLVLGPIEVLLPFIANDRFTDGAKTYGFILAFFGVGSALGALAVSSRRLPRRYLSVIAADRIYALVMLLMPVVLAGIARLIPAEYGLSMDRWIGAAASGAVSVSAKPTIIATTSSPIPCMCTICRPRCCTASGSITNGSLTSSREGTSGSPMCTGSW